MRIDIAELLRPHAREAEEEVLPAAPRAGSRAQRLQVGVFGLLAMVLLVGLANIIKTNADQTEAQVVPQAAPVAIATGKQEASDPLADAGVVPDLPAKNKVKDASGAAAPHLSNAPAPAARP
jgi:hypothetical protein